MTARQNRLLSVSYNQQQSNSVVNDIIMPSPLLFRFDTMRTRSMANYLITISSTILLTKSPTLYFFFLPPFAAAAGSSALGASPGPDM